MEFYLSHLERLLALSSVVFLAIIALFWIVLRKRKKKFAALILSLCFFYVLTEMIALFLRFFFPPITLVSDTLFVLIGLLLGTRFFADYIVTNLRHRDLPDYSHPSVLKDSVTKILDSEHFLTALRTALPSGEGDERYGFDFIPFMLNSIDERRRRAAKSARLFLIAMVIAALTFSGVVMYFGYILVNEASAGQAKTLAEIRDSTQSATQALQAVILSYYNNPVFQQNVRPKLGNLRGLDGGDKNRQVKEKIDVAIGETERTGDFRTLYSVLLRMTSEVNKDGAQGKRYSAALDDATDSMTAFLNAQGVAVPELNGRIEELKVLVPKAEDSLNRPENRVPEIIKRLALGVVIATFFLALLRYMGSLYRARYHQVLAAENDDFMVRRFYVAFKSSTASDEQRKAVLTSFMTTPTLNATEGKEAAGDGAKQEYQILKELVGALSKKL
jgi:hypothetical protein